jgi:hypothetical protein
MYSHSHFAPQRISMGNHRMGHCQTQVNSAWPRMSKTTIVEIQKQPIGIEVT